MPYAEPTFYVTVGGRMPGNEEWQIGFHLDQGPDGAPGGDAAAVANSLAPIFQQVFQTGNIAGALSSGCRAERVSAYYIPANQTRATQVGQAQIDAVGSGEAKLPNQCAIVCSFRTEDPSRRGRGRVYLPAVGLTIGTNGQVSSGVANGIAQEMAGLLFQMNSAEYNGLVLGGTSGNSIDRVLVDSVVDTQRRRRNRMEPATTANVGVAHG